MKYRLVLLLISLVWLQASEFSVATYNVENLFDEHKDGGEYDDYIPYTHNWTPKMVEIKLNHTAEVICELDADIIALQEIENPSILQRLQKRLKRVGCPYRYSSITREKTKSPIHVALLSRYPIIKEREIRVGYSPYDRNILECIVKIDSHNLTIFVNHWKSKSRGGRESRRVQYAKALRKRIDRLPLGREYIIVGDMNSHYDEYRVINPKLNDTNGTTGINHILKTIRNGKLIEKNHIATMRKGSHYNLWLEYPPYKRWSHSYYGKKGAIDHILLPYTLFDGKGIEYLDNSFAIFRPKFLLTKEGWINAWRFKHHKHLGKGYSDHLPIYARFTTQPYKRESIKEPIVKNIEYLYSVDKLSTPIKLKGCSLILKRGDNGVIKESKDGMAIYLYGVARGLKEGERYDIVVDKISTYNGLKEIIDTLSIKRVERVAIDDYYLLPDRLNMDDDYLQNQIFVNITATYRDNYLYIDGKKYRVYFKQKRYKPTNGSRLHIDFAHMGYYNRPQLVIYSKKDFTTQ
ncbi:hypothetical protein MNB_SV-6-578 [hydrothermal vent metagenome]|uniref:Endonuclease/exonuclease/phosphatase domain-containing protein n=1 Tax=hydrothermal vent metagenome TaxID=652676 RepID=A0A1W1CBI3_9ZZZZ